MKLTRVVFGVAYLYLSLAVCVLGRPLSERSPDTAIALEENHALAERLGITWSFSPIPGTQERHRIPVAHVRSSPNLDSERRSLRNVYISPRPSATRSYKGATREGRLSTVALVIIVISSVCFVLLVAGLVFWCCRKKTAPELGLLGSFKRRNPEIDEEKLYAQAKGDTHLSGF
ncbi:hypothetical protein KC19_9G060300 [Ceratodon purpureus]|uniref:Uncharacterized protein n=1 Tax=Ceratodon purpureus TaxID=3225 RepID=A0A8T0GP59_CERPU|nr:hypothetical protein KC19_9G060300 [Ceratodon purpureus]KAG0561381.1 hypothetical protein KC19_9G060300 [Ceratodon purpureus]